MPGTITRDGLILDMPVLDEATRSKMLDSMVAAFLQIHPDRIQDSVRKCQEASAASA